MNTQMFEHEAVRRNLETLAARGVRFVEPGEGYLACGWIGKGRLAEPDEIVAAAEAILRPEGPLRGQRVLVTAGPDLRGRRSGPLHRQPIERPHGLRDCRGSRAARRRGHAGHRARPRSTPPAVREVVRCGAPPRCIRP